MGIRRWLILPDIAKLAGAVDQLALPLRLFFRRRAGVRELIHDFGRHRGSFRAGRMTEPAVFGSMAESEVEQAPHGLRTSGLVVLIATPVVQIDQLIGQYANHDRRCPKLWASRTFPNIGY